MRMHSLVSTLILATVAGCTADQTSDDQTLGEEVERSVDSVSGQMHKVGSYALPTGSTLDVYEAGSGEFIIGERVPAGGHAADDTGAPASLTELYTQLTGRTAVPSELVEAEQRRLSFEAKLEESAPTRGARFSESTPEPEVDARAHTGLTLKEVARNVADFRYYECREIAGAKKTFTYCLTEKTGDTDQYKNDIYGSYTSVRPYRGSVTFLVRYNLTGWENAFNVTVNEGELYHARKVGPVRDYDINARVSNGAGDGWNLSVIGTSERGDKGWYSDYYCIAGICISDPV